MGKKNVMVSIDENILELFDKMRLNRSAVCEDALKAKAKPEINDVNPENILFRCSKCSKIVEFIYICPHDFKLYCRECELSTDCMHAVKEKLEPDGCRYHEHKRLPNLKGDMDKNLYKKAKETQYSDGLREMLEND